MTPPQAYKNSYKYIYFKGPISRKNVNELNILEFINLYNYFINGVDVID